MIPDGTHTAIVDGIEGEHARLVVEVERDGDGDRESHELIVPADRLPGDARHADAVLDVTVADGGLADAQYRTAETETRTRQAQDRFDRLSRRPPDAETGGDGEESADDENVADGQ